jgi:hypothetical protein
MFFAFTLPTSTRAQFYFDARDLKSARRFVQRLAEDSAEALEKALMFSGNFVRKKPENKGEGISPNYNNPHKGFALPGAKRFLSGSLGFFFSFYFLRDGLLG